jgi:hypothetical protein
MVIESANAVSFILNPLSGNLRPYNVQDYNIETAVIYYVVCVQHEVNRIERLRLPFL